MHRLGATAVSVLCLLIVQCRCRSQFQGPRVHLNAFMFLLKPAFHPANEHVVLIMHYWVAMHLSGMIQNSQSASMSRARVPTCNPRRLHIFEMQSRYDGFNTHTSGVAGHGARLDFSTLSPRAASISGSSGQTLEDAVLDFVDPDDSTVKSHWAILVAGSNGWGNYRHQADVCHAYQVLKAGGLKDERIIVLMYDDIANNEENPHQGTVVNSPGELPWVTWSTCTAAATR